MFKFFSQTWQQSRPGTPSSLRRSDRSGRAPSASFQPEVESLEGRSLPSQTGLATPLSALSGCRISDPNHIFFVSAAEGSPYSLTGRAVPQLLHLQPPQSTALDGATCNAAPLVAQLYRDMLGREADPTGLAAWNDLVNRGGWLEDVLHGILTSREYFAKQMDELYATYLHRPADPGGRDHFIGRLESGFTWVDVAADLVSSPEYFQQRGGGTNEGFLNALYQDALKRAPDSAGQAAFLSILQQRLVPVQVAGMSLYRALPGEEGARRFVAEQIFASPEYRQSLIQHDYERFLKRGADATGLEGWVNRMNQGLGYLDVILGFVTSEEYLTQLQSPQSV